MLKLRTLVEDFVNNTTEKENVSYYVVQRKTVSRYKDLTLPFNLVVPTDWYCGPHRSWQIVPDFSFVSHSGESWGEDFN